MLTDVDMLRLCQEGYPSSSKFSIV